MLSCHSSQNNFVQVTFGGVVGDEEDDDDGHSYHWSR